MRAPELLTAGPRARHPGLGRSLGRPLVGLALGASALAIAAYLASGRSLVPLAIPFGLLGAYVAARRPAFAIAALFVLTGFEGTLTASTRVPVGEATSLLLVALWVGVLATFLSGSGGRRTWLWPPLLGIGLYLALTLIAGLTSDSISDAFESFRISGFFMATGLLVALAPWSRETYLTIARTILLVGAAVGGYALFRYLAEPSAAELSLATARAEAVGQPTGDELRFFGSFGIAQNLAAWTSMLVPFALAFALGARGHWRWIALATTALCAFGALVSEVRTGVAAALAGAALVALAFGLARAFPGGRRLAVSLAAVLVATIAGVIVYSVTIGDSPEQAARYEQLIEDPANDPSYSTRIARWNQALDLAEQEPFGYGLGAQGRVGMDRETGTVGVPNLDNSYLKIAIEQGIVVMIFFAGALLILLLALVTFAARAVDAVTATFAIAGAGALASAIVLFAAGFFIEGIMAVPLWIAIGVGASQATARPTATGVQAGEP